MRMYFTLAVSAATREACAALAGAAERTDPRVMPITGPARVAWRGAVVVSDRASWAAAVTGRLRDPDPVMIGAFLSLGYPLGGATPFRGVRALRGDRALRAAGGRLAAAATRRESWTTARRARCSAS